MRWVVSVGTLVVVGLVVGLGMAGLFRVQAYLNHQAELHFEAQKGLLATKVSVTERGLRGPDNEPTQLVAGETDRPVHTSATDDASAISDITGSAVVTQDARILATDQLAADRNDSPSDARSVVLEADITDAQKLLRNAGEPRLQDTRRIGVSDLAEAGIAHQQNKGRVVPIRVIRAGAKPSVYMVPREQ